MNPSLLDVYYFDTETKRIFWTPPGLEFKILEVPLEEADQALNTLRENNKRLTNAKFRYS